MTYIPSKRSDLKQRVEFKFDFLLFPLRLRNTPISCTQQNHLIKTTNNDGIYWMETGYGYFLTITASIHSLAAVYAK